MKLTRAFYLCCMNFVHSMCSVIAARARRCSGSASTVLSGIQVNCCKNTKCEILV